MLSTSERITSDEKEEKNEIKVDNSYITTLLKIGPEDLKKIKDKMELFEVPESCLGLLGLSSSNRFVLINVDHLSIDDFKFIRALCSSDVPLKVINILGCNLGSIGMEYLLAGIKNHKTIKKICLINCKIQYDQSQFQGAIEIFKTLPLLEWVDLSRNCLSEDCDSFLNTDRTNRIRFNSKFDLVPSLSYPEKRLAQGEWLISLACKKNHNENASSCDKWGHAFILLEGIRENGQFLFERYHIVPDMYSPSNFFPSRVATVQHETLNPYKYNPNNFHAQRFIIDTNKVKNFKKMIAKLLGTKVNFHMVAQDVFADRILKRFNCVTWCMYILEEIGLAVNRPLLITPVTVAASERSCSIM